MTACRILHVLVIVLCAGCASIGAAASTSGSATSPSVTEVRILTPDPGRAAVSSGLQGPGRASDSAPGNDDAIEPVVMAGGILAGIVLITAFVAVGRVLWHP